MKNARLYSAFLFLLLLSAGLWWWLSGEAATGRAGHGDAAASELEIVIAQPAFYRHEKWFAAESVPRGSVPVIFRTSGMLEAGEVIPEEGTFVKKGQLICQVNNRDAFRKLTAQKETFAAELAELYPELEQRFPDVLDKWKRFAGGLQPDLLLPDLPVFQSVEERKLFENSGLLGRFSALRHAEAAMADYFFLAPFDGRLTNIRVRAGNRVEAGKTVATLIASGAPQLQARIPQMLVKFAGQWNRIPVKTAAGDTIGYARFVRRTGIIDEDGTMKHLFHLYEQKSEVPEHVPLLLGTTFSDTRLTSLVPVSALRSGKVAVLRNGKLVFLSVDSTFREKDLIFVSGLKSGDSCLMPFITHLPDTFRLKVFRPE